MFSVDFASLSIFFASPFSVQAAKCSQFPTELIQLAAARLASVLNDEKSREKAHLCATDNAVAALGAIVFNRGHCLQPSPEPYLNLWINNLPLKVDDEEGRIVHEELIELLLKVRRKLGFCSGNALKFLVRALNINIFSI